VVFEGVKGVDMIFVARQLLEKTREHGDSLFIMFMDLKKAHDSVPRSALWSILVKCGVPPIMLNLFMMDQCQSKRYCHG